MSRRNDGGPAFPHKPDIRTPLGFDFYSVETGDIPGMTLRDYFAAKAMQAYIGTAHADKVQERVLAECAYNMADAMIEARGGAK